VNNPIMIALLFSVLPDAPSSHPLAPNDYAPQLQRSCLVLPGLNHARLTDCGSPATATPFNSRNHRGRRLVQPLISQLAAQFDLALAALYFFLAFDAQVSS
jgi:hypothetical protein